MSDLYKELVLEHYKSPRNYGALAGATASSSVYNPLCGDMIRIEVLIKKNFIRNIRFSGKGCAISQAAASLLTEHVKHKAMPELQTLDKTFMIKLVGVSVGPSRLKCLLLPLEALHKLIKTHSKVS